MTSVAVRCVAPWINNRKREKIMREIKFRAKDRQHRWHYGDLRHHANKDVCIYPQDGNCGVAVDPLTVGQYTGMTDKDGKRIFEGDVVEVYDFTSVYASKYTGVVKMVRGCWRVDHYDTIFESVFHTPLMFDDFADKKTKVIGNTFENPELIKNINNEKE